MGEDRIDIKLLVTKALKYWYLYLLILPLAVGVAVYYLKTTPNVYEATSTVLIKEVEKSGQIIEEGVFTELGLDKNKKSIENEQQILASTPLMEKVVKKLGLEYTYVDVGGYKPVDLYKASPVAIVGWQPTRGGAILEGKLITNNSVKYTLEVEDGEYFGEFGKPLKTPLGQVTIVRSDFTNLEDPIEITAMSSEQRAEELVGELEVAAISENSSVLSLAIKDVVPERAVAILDELIVVYNQESRTDKSEVFKNSLDLINERIDLITQELSTVEQSVEAYRRQHSIMDLSAEGNLLLGEVMSASKDLEKNSVQIEMLSGIEDLLVRTKDNFNNIPINFTITNVVLLQQINQFNDLISRKGSNKLGPDHEDTKIIERQLTNLRQTIIENIRAIKDDLLMERESSQEMRANLAGRLQSLPRKERELLDIERMKGIKENLYIYLLQKREESAISMAIGVDTGKVIEPAGTSDPVSPKKPLALLISLFLGFAFPSALVLLLESLNDKVLEEKDVTKNANVQVLGMLPQGKKNERIVVKENDNSIAAEMFRSLRANLAFAMPQENLKTWMVTSTVPGEGKSYIALNMGLTNAMAGKKVLLIELDLRKPKQKEYTKKLNGTVDIGIADFLKNPALTRRQITHQSEFHENLDIIYCGEKPNNPSELMLSDRLRKFMAESEMQYDMIIIDAPPVGPVADALQLRDLVDATIYIIRADYTKISQLGKMRDVFEKKKLPNPFVVLNGVRLKKSQQYGYKYYASTSRTK